jgi:hypothetical protein
MMIMKSEIGEASSKHGRDEKYVRTSSRKACLEDNTERTRQVRLTLTNVGGFKMWVGCMAQGRAVWWLGDYKLLETAGWS